MSGRTLKPNGMTATVQLFDGSEMELRVIEVFCWNMKPDRVSGVDADGKFFRFKMDEEPFVLTWSKPDYVKPVPPPVEALRRVYSMAKEHPDYLSGVDDGRAVQDVHDWLNPLIIHTECEKDSTE